MNGHIFFRPNFLDFAANFISAPKLCEKRPKISFSDRCKNAGTTHPSAKLLAEDALFLNVAFWAWLCWGQFSLFLSLSPSLVMFLTNTARVLEWSCVVRISTTRLRISANFEFLVAEEQCC
jgi:hypothetical protein